MVRTIVSFIAVAIMCAMPISVDANSMPGCKANILNFNGNVIGSGCIPQGGQERVFVHQGAKSQTFGVTATDHCGLGLAKQNFTLGSNWSLQYGGPCNYMIS
jgi:hypothetical protein